MKSVLNPLMLGAVFLTAILPGGCVGADSNDWKLVFSDSGSDDWQEHWFLEGAKATVTNSETGMVFSAGPVPEEQASHAVLWTQRSFEGDLKIEYDYTRIDTNLNTGVNILYIQATGMGTDELPVDIFLSTDRRREPWMKYYFLHMSALHISYATEGRYVSARRYPAASTKTFNASTQFQPKYTDLDLFQPGERWHITAIKEGRRLKFIGEHDGRKHTFEWDLAQFPAVTEGRIGFRHMWTRCSRYENIRVSTK